MLHINHKGVMQSAPSRARCVFAELSAKVDIYLILKRQPRHQAVIRIKRPERLRRTGVNAATCLDPRRPTLWQLPPGDGTERRRQHAQLRKIVASVLWARMEVFSAML